MSSDLGTSEGSAFQTVFRNTSRRFWGSASGAPELRKKLRLRLVLSPVLNAVLLRKIELKFHSIKIIEICEFDLQIHLISK
jgi:hypothetical protein